MPIGFDKIRVHDGLLMSLPFREATGTITRDVAKPHHDPVTLIGVPTWASLAANDLGILSFNGVTDYLECAAAATADLDFTSGDYSIAVWVNWISTGVTSSEILVARYGVNLDGWEPYLTEMPGPIYYLTLRHHHASFCPFPPCPPGFERTGCYSSGWTPGVWCLLGITRSGAYPKHFRNGQSLTVTFDVGGLHDPDPCNRDLVIGTRFTKDDNWYQGQMWNPRIWGRELSPDEMSFIFERERKWFGV